MPTSSQDEKDAAAKQAAKRQLSQAPAVGPKDDDDAASDEQKKPASLGDAKSKEKAKGVGIQYVPVPKSNTAVTAAASSSSPPVEDEESSDAKKPAAKNVQLTDDQLKARAKSSMVSQAPALDPSEEASKKESQLTQQEKDKIAKKQAAAGRMTAAADQDAGQTQPGPGAYKYKLLRLLRITIDQRRSNMIRCMISSMAMLRTTLLEQQRLLVQESLLQYQQHHQKIPHLLLMKIPESQWLRRLTRRSSEMSCTRKLWTI